MASERLTITLPEQLAKRVRQKAKRSGQPVSQVVADALRKEEREEQSARLAAQYRENAAYARQIAEESWPWIAETLPDD